jgi:MFS family permease
MREPPATAAAVRPSEAQAGGASLVACVAALNVLSYVDRQLVVALAPLLMAELSLSRADIGLLVGASFIAVFAVGTLVVGLWADRANRPRLIAAGLALWSLGTALSSTATGLGTLVAWRICVGIGEAALPATALSMIGDRVEARRLGLATSVFYAGVPIGYGLSLAFSGLVAPRLGWRACFLALGLVGLLGSLLLLGMKDPRRRGQQGGTAGGAPLSSVLRGRPVLLALTAAAVLLVYTSAASQHTITWLVTERGFEFQRAAYLASAVILAGGLAGSVAIGTAGDRAARRGPGGRVLSLALASSVGLASSLGFYSLPSSSPAFIPCWFVSQGFLMGWYGALVAAVYEHAPDGRRASVIGVLLLTVNLLGVATGPWLTGVVGDRVSLTYALQWSTAPGVLGAAVLLATGLRERAAGR